MKLITSEAIDKLIATAGTNARRRTHHNVHESPADPIQRLFVAAKKDSYFRPHRHMTKTEFAIVIRGAFDLLIFDDQGQVTGRHAVGPETGIIAFEIPAGIWHSWIPTVDDSVFFEVKQGPYDATTAAEFAAWAPEEGSLAVFDFLARLRQAAVGDSAA